MTKNLTETHKTAKYLISDQKLTYLNLSKI